MLLLYLLSPKIVSLKLMMRQKVTQTIIDLMTRVYFLFELFVYMANIVQHLSLWEYDTHESLIDSLITL